MLNRQQRIVERAARAVAADGEELRLAREKLVAEVRREVGRPRSLLVALALGVAAGTMLRAPARGPRVERVNGARVEAVEAPRRREKIQRLAAAGITVARLVDNYLASRRPR